MQGSYTLKKIERKIRSYKTEEVREDGKEKAKRTKEKRKARIKKRDVWNETI